MSTEMDGAAPVVTDATLAGPRAECSTSWAPIARLFLGVVLIWARREQGGAPAHRPACRCRPTRSSRRPRQHHRAGAALPRDHPRRAARARPVHPAGRRRLDCLLMLAFVIGISSSVGARAAHRLRLLRRRRQRRRRGEPELPSRHRCVTSSSGSSARRVVPSVVASPPTLALARHATPYDDH